MLGEAGDCDGLGGLALCSWEGGQLSAIFDDDDGVVEDGVVGSGVFIDQGWDGSGEEGFRLDIAMSCYTESLGEPDQVGYASVHGDPVVWQMYWPELGLFVEGGNTYSENPDGIADGLSVLGSLVQF